MGLSFAEALAGAPFTPRDDAQAAEMWKDWCAGTGAKGTAPKGVRALVTTAARAVADRSKPWASTAAPAFAQEDARANPEPR